MSRLTNLLRQVEGKDEQLAADLRREFEVLSKRRAFGLNFERHVPETVELPGRPVRRGDKVRFLPERGADGKGQDRRLSTVARVRREKKIFRMRTYAMPWNRPRMPNRCTWPKRRRITSRTEI